jgi:hypothetical protein
VTNRSYTNWTKVIEDLQADPGKWVQVADNAGPSTIQRLRALGAEVMTDSVAPRTGEATYSRYIVWARWPTPETQVEVVQLELDTLTADLRSVKADLDAAEKEYNSAKQILNRNAYRRKQIREKYEPMLDKHDHLTAKLKQMKTEKD